MEDNLKEYSILEIFNEAVYLKSGLAITDLLIEPEGKEYEACQFKLNGSKVINRTAKITPKKVGQFVTFWKRNEEGITAPFSTSDSFDFYITNIKYDDRIGQFVFPKSVLAEKGIIATDKKEGKRGFRVYAPWDLTTNKQAQKTQVWQGDYFYLMEDSKSLLSLLEL